MRACDRVMYVPVTALLPPSTGPAPVTDAGLLVDALAAISPAAAAEAPDRPAATAAMQIGGY